MLFRSLSPLYTLYVSHSLSLPSLYSTLYRLLTPGLLHSPHRSHSLRLLSLFLSSDKLPLSTVLAFLKRLARLALRGPPGGIIPVSIITYNLLKKHKEGMVVLHRDAEEQGWKDPYVSSLDTAPNETNSLSTSLVELSSLGALNTNNIPPFLIDTGRQLEAHYHAPTTTIVKTLAQPFTKEAYDVEDFLDHGYSSLIRNEVERSERAAVKRRKLAASAAASSQQQPPPPAVRFTAPNDLKRVRVFPKRSGTTKDQKSNPAASATATQTETTPRTGFAPAPADESESMTEEQPPP